MKDEGINEEGHGGNKDKKDESNEHPGDPLTRYMYMLCMYRIYTACTSNSIIVSV